MWFEHKAEKADQANRAGEEELERALKKVLPDALMQALQWMLTNVFAPMTQGSGSKIGGFGSRKQAGTQGVQGGDGLYGQLLRGIAPKTAVVDEVKALFPILCSKLAQAAQKGGSKLDVPAAEAPLLPLGTSDLARNRGCTNGVHALSQQQSADKTAICHILFLCQERFRETKAPV